MDGAIEQPALSYFSNTQPIPNESEVAYIEMLQLTLQCQKQKKEFYLH